MGVQEQGQIIIWVNYGPCIYRMEAYMRHSVEQLNNDPVIPNTLHSNEKLAILNVAHALFHDGDLWP